MESFSYQWDLRVWNPKLWLRRVTHGGNKGHAHLLHKLNDLMEPFVEVLGGGGLYCCNVNQSDLLREVVICQKQIQQSEGKVRR